MKALLLLSFLSVILVCGCVEINGLTQATSSTSTGNGMEITSFTAEPATVFSGESVRVAMEAENDGGTSVAAGDSFLYLTGASFSDWDNGNSQIIQSIDKEMRSADVVTGMPASTDMYSVTLKAPPLDSGQTNNYIFIGRLYSKYQTSANGNIWVYSDSEAEAAKAAGRQMYTPSFTTTEGPVGLSVSVTPSPIILYQGGDNMFTVYIKISNDASGTIYSPDAKSGSVALTMDQINRVNVKVTPGNGLTIDSTDGCEGNDQELVAGKDLTLVCEVTVGKTPATFQSYPFEVDVSYGYYTEKTTSVTVQGRTTSTSGTSTGTSSGTSSSSSSSSGTTQKCSSISGVSLTPCDDYIYAVSTYTSSYDPCNDFQMGCVHDPSSESGGVGTCSGTPVACSSRTNQNDCINPTSPTLKPTGCQWG